MIWLKLAGLVVLVLIAARIVVAVVRFARLSPAARRHYPAALRARRRWRWLARNVGLAYNDPHSQKRIHELFLPFLFGAAEVDRKKKVCYPRARFRPDAYGIVARVKIRRAPRSGRKEFDAQAVPLADSWKCTRVGVTQVKPGQLLVRGLYRDPLLEPIGPDAAPEGTYDGSVVPSRLFVGVDEWAAQRWLPLAGLTGITCTGLPNYGKTSFIQSVLAQLAGSDAVQFALADGKGSSELGDWSDRSWLRCGDSLAACLALVEDVHSLMRSRLHALEADRTLERNGWRTGPASANPLIVTVMDECHTFFDLDAHKGDRDAEPMVKRIRTLTGQLIRQGRSVLFLTLLATQRGTIDAIPSQLRDNAGFGMSFAVRTRDGAVAGLGEGIRDFATYCPTLLRAPGYVGVATTTLPSGMDPFCRVRIPYLTEAAVLARATATARYRRDPSVVPFPVVTAAA